MTWIEEATSFRSVRIRVPARVSVAWYPVSRLELTSKGESTIASSSKGLPGCVAGGGDWVCAARGHALAMKANAVRCFLRFLFMGQRRQRRARLTVFPQKGGLRFAEVLVGDGVRGWPDANRYRGKTTERAGENQNARKSNISILTGTA